MHQLLKGKQGQRQKDSRTQPMGRPKGEVERQPLLLMGKSLWYIKVKVHLASRGHFKPLPPLEIMQLIGKLQRLG